MVRPLPEDAAGAGSGPVRRPAGRPRDEQTHARILGAAGAVFCAEGWRGFSLEAVARAASVGKSTMYLRWSSRDELILETLQAYSLEWVDVDTGDIREDLRALATAYGRAMDTPAGPLGLRWVIESYTNAEFAAVSAGLRRTAVRDAHAIIRRAKKRGQLRPDASAAVILDALFGALMHHLSSTQDRVPGGLYSSRHGEPFIDSIVDMVLCGAAQPHEDDPPQQRPPR